VFRYSSELGGHTNLMEFANRLLLDLLQVAEADGLVLRLLSGDGRKLETALLGSMWCLKPVSTLRTS